MVLRDDRVLLIQRLAPPFEGHFALPGGFVDQDESTAACALRELAEETGLSGTIDSFVGVYDDRDRDPWRHTITFAYRISVPPGSTPVAADDAQQVCWMPLAALPPLAFDHGRIVQDALRTGPYTPS